MATKNNSKRNRSPSYPVFDLEKAVEMAKNFYKAEGFNEALVDIAVKSWGLTPGGSAGYRTVAALLHYGIFEDEGSGDERIVYLTELGKTIVLDERENSEERKKAIRNAALNPKIFRDLWEKWGPDLPSDENMNFHLVRNLGFNRKHVQKFINSFRSTIEYANLFNRQEEVEETELEEAPKENAETISMESEKSDRNIDSFPSGGNDDFLDIPIPLIKGSKAILRLPIPLSEKDYNLVRNTINSYLKSMKPAIVRNEKHGKNNNEEEGGTARSH